MANPQHVEILKQGVGAWNDWRNANPVIETDLSGLALYDTLPLTQNQLLRVEGANLANVDFRRSDLTGTDFYGGFNHGANLTGANLREAKLNEALLGEANLENADLWQSDISGASLWGANLTNANLAFANLFETDLRGADLTGANLTGAELWKATLYGSDGFYKEHPQRFHAKVVNTAGKVLDSIRYIKGLNPGVNFYFRGQNNIKWGLCPSVMRNEAATENEGKLLVELASRFCSILLGG